jgi:hypothetical protein
LLFSTHSIFPSVLPEAAELRICYQAWQQIICYRSYRIVSAQAGI